MQERKELTENISEEIKSAMSLRIHELKTEIQTTASQLRKEQQESYTRLEAGLDTVKDGARVLENRILSLEQNASTSGDHSHKEILKKDITASRFRIRMLGMKDETTKVKAKNYITKSLTLTDSALASMGIKQVFRLGKIPEKGDLIKETCITSILN